MNRRSIAVLNQIIKSNSYISVEKISDLFNVSRRTIYNDLDKINDWLKVNYGVEVSQVRGRGLYLEPSLKRQILENVDIAEITYYVFSKEERRAWIYIYIVGQSHPCYLSDFQDLFQVSRNTVIEDIKLLKEILSDYQLDLASEKKRGYEVQGDEIVVRRFLIQYLSSVFNEKTWRSFGVSMQNTLPERGDGSDAFNRISEDLLQIRHYLIQYEYQVEVEITDDVRENLILWFYFFIQRIKQGYYAEVDPAEREVIHATKEFHGANTLCECFSYYFQIRIPRSEIDYLTRYLLSAKVNYSLSLQLENRELKELTVAVEKMVSDFQVYAAVDFPDQKRMIHNLLLHLKPTFYRKKYGIQIENVLKDSVKENYPEVFYLTKSVIHHLENLIGQSIDENEIAFIAMHFGGWLRKEGVVLDRKRKKLLIVCTNGLGTSLLLKSQLEELFSNADITGVTSIREYKGIRDLATAADFIVSTVQLPERDIPVFVVNPILSNQDKEQLLRKVNSLFEGNSKQQIVSVDTIIDMVHRYASIHDEQSLRNELKAYLHSPHSVMSEMNKPGLLDLLTDDRIHVQSRVNTWKEGIYEAALPLLNQGYITSNYIAKMIQVVEESGPYIVISEQVALPHAHANEGVKKTGMSMLLLKHPVVLMDKPVCLFIVLASIDNEQHLKALSQLTRTFSDKKAKQEIMNSNSKTELVSRIQTYLKE